jgi:CRISPR/Cas system-associated exonuclease Cas4 (RecB family)
MPRYPKQWRVVKPKAWPESPTEMSVSLFRELEDCPRKWALEHAYYPEIWDRYGYPRRIHLAALVGILAHSCIEIIIRELAHVGCGSMQDEKATQVMRSLGGYSDIIGSCIESIIESYEGNPRTKWALDLIHSSLWTRIADIREKVQFLLARMSLDESGALSGGSVASSYSTERHSALPYGVHPEVDIQVPAMHWRGRADLVVLTDTTCELVDFKTGQYDEHHEFQMQVYALLWYKDPVLNPSSRPANKLTISYLHESVQVPVPTVESLGNLEADILERTKELLDTISTSPPSPLPCLERCIFCDVRHLCEAYWRIRVGADSTAKATKGSLVDVEITLTQQQSPFSWSVAVDGGPYLKSGLCTILRIPPNHYLTHCAILGDRLRILDSTMILDTSKESESAYLTLSNYSEAYVIETEVAE